MVKTAQLCSGRAPPRQAVQVHWRSLDSLSWPSHQHWLKREAKKTCKLLKLNHSCKHRKARGWLKNVVQIEQIQGRSATSLWKLKFLARAKKYAGQDCQQRWLVNEPRMCILRVFQSSSSLHIDPAHTTVHKPSPTNSSNQNANFQNVSHQSGTTPTRSQPSSLAALPSTNGARVNQTVLQRKKQMSVCN